MVVFPTALLDHCGSKALTDGRVDFRKSTTKHLLRMHFAEMFDLFPLMDGVIVRCGETYVQGTPHHTGNLPVLRDSFNVTQTEQRDVWVEFTTLL
jgi:hypothetical protein